jgi:hypothetical protein
VIAALPPEDQPEYGSAKELPRPCFRYWPLRSNVNALAWGYESHRIVAEIAEQFLEPETAHRVRNLLAVENRTTLAEVSTWADQIRPQHPETRRWHFVNIPIHPPAGENSGYDAIRDCPQYECVVAKIEQFEGVTDLHGVNLSKAGLNSANLGLGASRRTWPRSGRYGRGRNDQRWGEPLVVRFLRRSSRSSYCVGAIGGLVYAYSVSSFRRCGELVIGDACP